MPSAKKNAEAAVAFVCDQMKVKTTNRWGDRTLSDRTLTKVGDLYQAKVVATMTDLDTAYPNAHAALVGEASMARAVMDGRVGNCEQMAALALAYLAQKGHVLPVEKLYVVGADHTFVLVGRTQGTYANWATWNETAYICDPWAGYSGSCTPAVRLGWLRAAAAKCIDKPADVVGPWQSVKVYLAGDPGAANVTFQRTCKVKQRVDWPFQICPV